jgi:hypothetical protein
MNDIESQLRAFMTYYNTTMAHPFESTLHRLYGDN